MAKSIYLPLLFMCFQLTAASGYSKTQCDNISARLQSIKVDIKNQQSRGEHEKLTKLYETHCSEQQQQAETQLNRFSVEQSTTTIEPAFQLPPKCLVANMNRQDELLCNEMRMEHDAKLATPDWQATTSANTHQVNNNLNQTTKTSEQVVRPKSDAIATQSVTGDTQKISNKMPPQQSKSESNTSDWSWFLLAVLLFVSSSLLLLRRKKH